MAEGIVHRARPEAVTKKSKTNSNKRKGSKPPGFSTRVNRKGGK